MKEIERDERSLVGGVGEENFMRKVALELEVEENFILIALERESRALRNSNEDYTFGKRNDRNRCASGGRY